MLAKSSSTESVTGLDLLSVRRSMRVWVKINSVLSGLDT